MADCSGCGTTLHCRKGCYMVCTVDCSDCSGGCEPRTVLSPMRFAQDAKSRATTDVRFCGHELEPQSLLDVLGSLLDLKLAHVDRARSGLVSLQHVGTVAELLAAAGVREVAAD